MRLKCSKTIKTKFTFIELGRKKALTTIDNRNLLRLCKQNRTKTSQKLSSELVLLNEKQLSVRIIRRRVLNMGWKSYTTKSKSFRKPEHIKKSDFLLQKNIRGG